MFFLDDCDSTIGGRGTMDNVNTYTFWMGYTKIILALMKEAGEFATKWVAGKSKSDLEEGKQEPKVGSSLSLLSMSSFL